MAERTGFEANSRLLQLLVGSNLYPTPDVCVRELLQNAWDAIELRRASGDDQGGSIVVRFSASERWFEVEDDGIGMDRRELKASFLSVGSDKLEVLGAQGQAGEQVAFFGIGVLSAFLVASHAEVVTRKAAEEQGLRVRIEGLGENDVEIETAERDSIGTTIRVWIKPETSFHPALVPEAVRKYARHVPGVAVEDQDSGSRSDIGDIWDTEGLIGEFALAEDAHIRDGRMGFTRTLTDQTPVVSNPITLCNGGFLVEAGATDLLQVNPIGFSGELDLHANALSVVMARERFQRDDK